LGFLPIIVPPDIERIIEKESKLWQLRRIVLVGLPTLGVASK
jgi:hypothetical protein